MNNATNQVLYYIVETQKEFDSYDEFLLCTFTDKKAAISKAKELCEKDNKESKAAINREGKYSKKLCDKYGITDKDPFYIEEKIYKLATEEEIDKYDDLYYKMLAAVPRRFYYIYKYEVNEDGTVTVKRVDVRMLDGDFKDE